MTAAEAREISFEKNKEIKSIINEIKQCAFNGRMRTDFIECDIDCEILLEGMGYTVFRKGWKEVQISW